MAARARYAIIPLMLAALVPKCPLCVAAYASAIGLGAVAALLPAIARAAEVTLGLVLVAMLLWSVWRVRCRVRSLLECGDGVAGKGWRLRLSRTCCRGRGLLRR